MAKNDTFIFKFVHVIFWCIFIGLCIKTGSLIFSVFLTSENQSLHLSNKLFGINLNEVAKNSIDSYQILTSILILFFGLQAFAVYWVLEIFKILPLENPFKVEITIILKKFRKVLALAVLLGFIGEVYCDYLKKFNVEINIQWGFREILFSGLVLYLLTKIYEKAVALKEENDLTV